MTARDKTRERKQFSLWIKKDDFAKLEEKAQDMDLSIAWVINQAIKQYLR